MIVSTAQHKILHLLKDIEKQRPVR